MREGGRCTGVIRQPTTFGRFRGMTEAQPAERGFDVEGQGSERAHQNRMDGGERGNGNGGRYPAMPRTRREGPLTMDGREEGKQCEPEPKLLSMHGL